LCPQIEQFAKRCDAICETFPDEGIYRINPDIPPSLFERPNEGTNMNPYPYKLTKIAAILLGGTLLGSGIAPAQESGDNTGAEVLTMKHSPAP
jgi:hypothetical protein